MIKVVVFGGTTEGRRLCEFCAEHAVPILYCVATEDGARVVSHLPNISVHIGRLGAGEMAELLSQNAPAHVYDATHPYAEETSRNIEAACHQTGMPLLRVVRENADPQGCIAFDSMDNLLTWLESEPGNIFVTTGSSHARAFACLRDFQNRVWLRILPSIESLKTCLELGYRPDRLICMQGPFSEDLNYAMFKAVNANILVTKNSGSTGGFSEKVRAARSLEMRTAVLSKPAESMGISLEEACKRLMELTI